MAQSEDEPSYGQDDTVLEAATGTLGFATNVKTNLELYNSFKDHITAAGYDDPIYHSVSFRMRVSVRGNVGGWGENTPV